jgi:DnaJ-class molecular chaperone
MYELEYNQPTFPKDAEYCECYECNGTGEVLSFLNLHEDLGFNMDKETCWKCSGTGELEITE